MRNATPILAIITALLTGNAVARPIWAKDAALRRSGDKLFIICDGDGPAIDIARKQALDNCKASAAEAINGETIVSTLVVNTENDAALHEEVKSSASWSGLLCKPVRESIEESDTKTIVFIECVFDLKGVQRVEDKSATESPAKQAQNRSISSATITVNLATIPACDSILIGGRVVRCTSNPLPLTIKPTDTTIILRTNGYKPKTIDASALRGTRNETIVFD